MHTCVYVCIYSCVHICHHLFAGSPAATHIVAKATQTFPFFYVFTYQPAYCHNHYCVLDSFIIYGTLIYTTPVAKIKEALWHDANFLLTTRNDATNEHRARG